ncbi:D-serine ammonia-lyase [Marixanthomonas spongiae]|uniref:Probable D-serine dehydratase n=1 Tax=Marixanthomonas spongiae TaxID=2174845 RepID=A0A2U0HSK2_9FLAO|nr:D-serine ammonia-lyase [Marixanthomonas spongiae]PVW11814.1 D-serine ammonia-lyase [Marixanthomonas spongiae]
MYSKSKIKSLVSASPILKDIMDAKPVSWLNPELNSVAHTGFSITLEDMKAAERLWNRFAPFFEKGFPETKATNGILESPLREIAAMQSLLNETDESIKGRLLLKCDNELPVSGSIKARGGFFEIMKYAEQLAMDAGLLDKEDDYSFLTSGEFNKFFGNYKIGVGSTGNLGLSIGIISAALGFQVTVYVSSDAKKWKKDLLRDKGVTVIEFDGDFSKAITAGREKTKADPQAYFVDDEDSRNLFLGYTVGALRIARQIEEQNIKVDASHPLFVYSPCGVGGSPGGTAFGLKQIYGDHVHCFYIEPTHCPAVLTGLVTGEMSDISVQDIGLDNKTEADGLAVGRPSHFATKISKQLVSGIFTVEDKRLFKLLAQLKDTENIFLEPSATAGFIGPPLMQKTEYAKKHKLPLHNATHIVWATGGLLVPEEQRQHYYKKGCEQLSTAP